jgi:ion channel-forming bestrophin family protein
MFTHRRFTLLQSIAWTYRDLIMFALLSVYPVCLYELIDLKWLAIPHLPIVLIGTAVAFNLGFKNNNAYNRVWEARKIWGAITNISRAWGMVCIDFVSNQYTSKQYSDSELQEIQQLLIYRHLAWITALRYQLRSPKEWELQSTPAAIRFREKFFVIAEHHKSCSEALSEFTKQDELDDILSKSNPAVHILRLQSNTLKDLNEKGLIDNFRHIAMQEMITSMLNQQGGAERIKNFPFPRQYASMSFFFVVIFITILPFTLLGPLAALGEGFVWLTIPFNMLVSWIFYSMEKVGDLSENPFEGRGTDVPITTICRSIEISLKEILNEKNLPEKLTPVNHIVT